MWVVLCRLWDWVGTRYIPGYTDVPSHLGAGSGGGRHEGHAELLSRGISVFSLGQRSQTTAEGDVHKAGLDACSQEHNWGLEWLHSPFLSSPLCPSYASAMHQWTGEKDTAGVLPHGTENL